MMVNTTGNTLGLIRWQWKLTTLFTIGGVVAALIHQLGITWLELPAIPLAVVGGAIGIFVSFRTNAAYDRWWEGRKLWGRLINTSRHWCTQVLGYVDQSAGDEPTDELRATAHRMIWRHITYVHVLRTLLRKQSIVDDEELTRILDGEERARLAGQSNATHALLQDQMDDMRRLHKSGAINSFNQSDMDESVRHLLDIQGGCERIKKTPFPRGYGFIAERLILAYGFLFPFAVVSELGWLCVPMNVLVCLAFALIGEAGRVLEDPFSVFYNGLPLAAISRTIEVNLRERLGESDLPPLLTPNEHGILM